MQGELAVKAKREKEKQRQPCDMLCGWARSYLLHTASLSVQQRDVVVAGIKRSHKEQESVQSQHTSSG